MTVPRAKACVIVLTFISALLGVIPALSHAIYRDDNISSDVRSHGSSLALASNGTWTTPGPSASTSALVFINKIVLGSDDNIELALRGADISYKTDKLGDTYSTLTSYLATRTPNTTLSPASTNSTSTVTQTSSVDLDGVCVESEHILSAEFVSIYQHVYAGTFLFDFIVLAILYALIYRSILVRRAWKSKRKRMIEHPSTNYPEPVAEETQLTNINGKAVETVVLKKNSGRFSSVMRDRALHANIKTAAMLFVVTLGFIISFLPSWLMGLRIVPLKLIVFYMFYINNVINPFIYAFMNRTFRDDLFQLLKTMFRRR